MYLVDRREPKYVRTPSPTCASHFRGSAIPNTKKPRMLKKEVLYGCQKEVNESMSENARQAHLGKDG